MRADALCLIIIFFTLLQENRACFLTSDGISDTLNVKAIFVDKTESFIDGSLWNNGRKYRLKSFFILLLMLAGYIELNPDPREVPELDQLFSRKGFKIFHQNVHGLHAHLELITVFSIERKNTNILTLSETHTQGTDNFLVFDIPEFTFIRKSRKSGKGGGVGMYIADKHDFIRREDLEAEGIESIFIDLLIKNLKNMLILTFYRHLDLSIYLSNIFDQLLQIKLSLATKENKDLILLGDLNVKYSSKQDHKEMKDIFKLNGMPQVINDDSRFDIHHNTSTLIDVIFAENDFAVTRTSVIPMSIEDHDMVGCIYKLNNARFSQKNIHCRDYENYDPLLMNRDIRRSRINEVDKMKNVNDAWNHTWNHIKNIWLEVFQKHAPIINKRVRGKPCPWLTNDRKSQINTRDKPLKKMRKTQLQFDINAYKEKQNEVNIALRKAKSKYFKNLYSENTNSPKKFCKTLKSIFPIKNKSNNSKSFLVENEFTSMPSKIATGFANFHTNIASVIKSSLFPLNNIIWRKSPKRNSFTYKTFKFR